jgi:hypothetical protein
MLSTGFARGLAVNAFKHRATTLAGGRVVYRLADGSGHVELDRREWQSLGENFHDQVRPLGRKANWMIVGLLPGTLLFALTIGQLIPFAGLMILAALLLGPILIYLWHSRQVQRVAAEIEAQLARRPQAAAVPADPARIPRALDIACMLLVGPGLILAIVGELGGPDTFRNTPFVGTDFDASAWVATALILARLLWPRLVRPRSASATPGSRG